MCGLEAENNLIFQQSPSKIKVSQALRNVDGSRFAGKFVDFFTDCLSPEPWLSNDTGFVLLALLDHRFRTPKGLFGLSKAQVNQGLDGCVAMTTL